MHTRTQAKKRIQAVREETTRKLASVGSDVFGTSGRRMLAAFSSGARAPQTLAARA